LRTCCLLRLRSTSANASCERLQCEQPSRCCEERLLAFCASRQLFHCENGSRANAVVIALEQTQKSLRAALASSLLAQPLGRGVQQVAKPVSAGALQERLVSVQQATSVRHAAGANNRRRAEADIREGCRSAGCEQNRSQASCNWLRSKLEH